MKIIKWLVWLGFLGIECMIFVKKLHDDKYPGQCYPVHIRVGKKKKYDLIALKPGEERRDPNTCGVTACINSDGLAYVYYCPSTLPSSECSNPEALDTIISFPECCWTCRTSKECSEGEVFPAFPYPPPNKG